jgi:SAM-dependent methyltransferase
MRRAAKDFLRSVLRERPGLDPVFEFGSLQVPGQVGWADLRPEFAGRPFTGCDMRPGPGVDRVEDLEALSLADGSAGTVVCIDTLEHVRRPRLAAAEMTRVLAPGGLLVVATCFRFPVHRHPADYWRFTPDGLRELFRPPTGPPQGLAEFHVSWDGPDEDPVGVYGWGVG